MNKFLKVVAHVKQMNNFKEQIELEQKIDYEAANVHDKNCISNKINLQHVDKETAMNHALNKLKHQETFNMLYSELIKFKDEFWV